MNIQRVARDYPTSCTLNIQRVARLNISDFSEQEILGASNGRRRGRLGPRASRRIQRRRRRKIDQVRVAEGDQGVDDGDEAVERVNDEVDRCVDCEDKSVNDDGKVDDVVAVAHRIPCKDPNGVALAVRDADGAVWVKVDTCDHARVS